MVWFKFGTILTASRLVIKQAAIAGDLVELVTLDMAEVVAVSTVMVLEDHLL